MKNTEKVYRSGNKCCKEQNSMLIKPLYQHPGSTVNWNLPLERPLVLGRGCTEKPQTVYSTSLTQKVIDEHQWGACDTSQSEDPLYTLSHCAFMK